MISDQAFTLPNTSPEERKNKINNNWEEAIVNHGNLSQASKLKAKSKKKMQWTKAHTYLWRRPDDSL
jgi:hypothetical protein